MDREARIARRSDRSVPRDISVVVSTRDRAGSLIRTLAKLDELPERPPVIVVDNASSDDTAARVQNGWSDVTLLSLRSNLGAAARNVGVEAARTPFVAFSDDDSWWAPGALASAARVLRDHPSVALVAGRILVGPEERLDPTCELMAWSRLEARGNLPGTPVLGFVACGAVVRRDAFLRAGGFDARFGVGGEEALLAIDLSTQGWDMIYVPEVVAHHHPSMGRDRSAGRRVRTRNDLWVAWLRRRPWGALRRTLQVAWPAWRERSGRAGALDALKGLGWVLGERRPVAPELDERLRAIGQ